jgi:hypothetical protein
VIRVAEYALTSGGADVALAVAFLVAEELDGDSILEFDPKELSVDFGDAVGAQVRRGLRMLHEHGLAVVSTNVSRDRTPPLLMRVTLRAPRGGAHFDNNAAGEAAGGSSA